jgi:hypothetical protein
MTYYKYSHFLMQGDGPEYERPLRQGPQLRVPASTTASAAVTRASPSRASARSHPVALGGEVAICVITCYLCKRRYELAVQRIDAR